MKRLLIVTPLVLCLAASHAQAQPYQPYGVVYVESFGAIGNNPPINQDSSWVMASNAVNDGPALQRAIDNTPLGGTLKFAHCRYQSNQTLVVKRDITIEASSSGLRISQAMCGIRFAPGIPGIQLEAGVTVRGLAISPLGHGAKINPLAHGITMHQSSVLEGVSVTGFEGDGIHIEASTPVNNASMWRVLGGAAVTNLGNGLYVRGADANAGIAINFSAIGNKKMGIFENSFLGNLYLGCHSEGNSLGAVSSGLDTDATGKQVENRNNSSVFLHTYEEDGTTSHIGAGSIWIGGQGRSAVDGLGAILRKDGRGFSADHWAALVNGRVKARIGSLSGAMSEVWNTPRGGMYVMPSVARKGWIDAADAITNSKVWWRVSTSSSADGPGILELPAGARMGNGGANITSSTFLPTTGNYRVGDIVINSSPQVNGPWAWQVLYAAPLMFRPLTAAPAVP